VRVELPDGHSAEFRELTDLTSGDAKAYRRAAKFKVTNGTLEEISMDVADKQMDALLTRIILTWTMPEYGSPQIDPEVLDRLPLKVYDALVDAAQPYKEAVDRVGKSPTTSANESTGTSSPAIEVSSDISTSSS